MNEHLALLRSVVGPSHSEAHLQAALRHAGGDLAAAINIILDTPHVMPGLLAAKAPVQLQPVATDTICLDDSDDDDSDDDDSDDDDSDDDDDSEDEDSEDEDSDSDDKAAVDEDIGFDWDDDKVGKNEDGDDSDEDEGPKSKSKSKRERAKEKAQKELELHRREQALRDKADAAPETAQDFEKLILSSPRSSDRKSVV